MTPQIITRDTLEEYGIATNESSVEALLTHLNETLEERVGAEVAESLTDKQLEELSDLQEKATDEEIGNWINDHVEELDKITQDEINILLGEIAENSEQISES